MFGWFQPKCPVDPESKEWIEQKMAWLAGEFGRERLTDAPTVLPHTSFFPDVFDATESAARRLFDRTCQYMDQDPSRIELEFYRPASQRRFGASEFRPMPDWSGLYQAQEQKARIWIDVSHLHDPESLVATYAHELAHAHLLGPSRILPDEKNGELLTDLTTVFFGLGIFGANVAYRKESYVLGLQHFTSYSRQGYLSVEMWAYALALFAFERREARPAWIRYLRHNVRSPFRAGLAYLMKNGTGTVASGHSTVALPTYVDTIVAKQPPSEIPIDDANVFRECELDTQDATDADEKAFTTGIEYMQTGEWESAICEFSLAIKQSPKDDEAYQMRSQCLLEAGRFEEALVDAERCVVLAPEDPEGRRIRGIAYLHTGRFELAISDLTWYIREEDNSSSEPSRVSRAYYFRGLAYARSNDLRRAVADHSTAIIRWPNWPEPFMARADIFDQLGNAARARADRVEASRRPSL